MQRRLQKRPALGQKPRSDYFGVKGQDFVRGYRNDAGGQSGSAGQYADGQKPGTDRSVEALTALGYSPSEALRAVKAVLQETPDLDVEALLKAALKKMF